MSENLLSNVINMTSVRVQSEFVQITKTEYESLRTENAQLKSERNKYYEELRDAVKNHDMTYAKLNADIANLRIENANLRTENANLRTENEKLRDEIRILKNENALLKNEIVSLKTNIISINTRLNENTRAINKLQQEKKDLKFITEEKQSKITNLQTVNQEKNLLNLDQQQNIKDLQQKVQDLINQRNHDRCIMISAEICKHYKKIVVDYVFDQNNYCRLDKEYAILYDNLTNNKVEMLADQEARWLSIKNKCGNKANSIINMNIYLQGFLNARNSLAHPTPKHATVGELKKTMYDCIEYLGGDIKKQHRYKFVSDFVIKTMKEIKGEYPLDYLESDADMDDDFDE